MKQPLQCLPSLDSWPKCDTVSGSVSATISFDVGDQQTEHDWPLWRTERYGWFWPIAVRSDGRRRGR